MRKKIYIITGIVLFAISLGIFAIWGRNLSKEEQKVTLRYNCEIINLKNEPGGFIDKHNITMVPIELVADKMGAKTNWNENTKTLSVKKGNIEMNIVLGKKQAIVNNKTVKLDTVAIMRENRIFVPITFISKTFGTMTEWSKVYNTVSIYDPKDMSINDIKRIRNYRIDVKYPEGITTSYNFDDANVNVYNPLNLTFITKLNTYEGKLKNNNEFLDRAKFAAESVYTFNYKDTTKYRQNLIDLYVVKYGTMKIDGKWIDTTQAIDAYIEKYKEKGIICEAKFVTDPSLVYEDSEENIIVRGILRYKIMETKDKKWWFGDTKSIHEPGNWYEKDAEVKLYELYQAKQSYKKLKTVTCLCAPRLIQSK